ncbi:MAG: hypothetical protein ACREX4_24925 [Gammaproteobacteria bacterium]
MHIERRKIGIDEELQVSSELALPERFGACPGLILTHGAGNDMHQRMLSHVHQRSRIAGSSPSNSTFRTKKRAAKHRIHRRG